MRRKLLAIVILLCANSPVAWGGDLGRVLVEISLRASLQVTSEITFHATTDETSPSSCHYGHRYSTCMRIDPALGDQLVREAFAGRGEVLRDFAEGLDVPEAAMAAAIIDRMPAAPTRTELSRVLVISGPALGA